MSFDGRRHLFEVDQGRALFFTREDRMDCLTCGGACCQRISIPLSSIRPAGVDVRVWAKLHGPVGSGELTATPRRCSELTTRGHCGIYERRPAPCRAYEPGADQCLATVRDLRTRAQYARIRDDADPEVADLYS